MARTPGVVVLAVACLLLTGCAPTVTMVPAAMATSTACARVIVGLRDVQSIGGAARRNTDAQGTAAWGTPASVTMYCGVTSPKVSALPCFTRDGVDWLRQTDHGHQVLLTYGRTRAVQVLITGESAVPEVVEAISDAVADGTQGSNKVCLSSEDATTAPNRPPTATLIPTS